jgi:hypothetical protein
MTSSARPLPWARASRRSTVRKQYPVPSGVDVGGHHRQSLPQRELGAFSVGCSARERRAYRSAMRVATGKVVNGAVKVADAEFKDGTEVFILSREREDGVHLSPEELAELEAGIAEADRGETIPGDEFFARLRRYR